MSILSFWPKLCEGQVTLYTGLVLNPPWFLMVWIYWFCICLSLWGPDLYNNPLAIYFFYFYKHQGFMLPFVNKSPTQIPPFHLILTENAWLLAFYSQEIIIPFLLTTL